MITTKDSLVFEDLYSISIMIKLKKYSSIFEGDKLVAPIFIGPPNYKKGQELKIDVWPYDTKSIEIYPGITANIEVKRSVKTIITKVKLLKRKKQCFVDVKEL